MKEHVVFELMKEHVVFELMKEHVVFELMKARNIRFLQTVIKMSRE